MEELEMKRRDKHRDFVKQEGANFLGGVKFYNASIEPHLKQINNLPTKNVLPTITPQNATN
jgi:hypothetical protein